MQNIYIVILMLILSIYSKSVFGNLFLNDQSENRYRLNGNDLLKIKELLQSVNAENGEHFVDYSKNDNVNSNDYDMTESTEYKVSHDGRYDDDAVRLLWNIYMDLLEQKEKSRDEIRELGIARKHDKRALTMLSRWKPFRINTLNGGNGRHVIRSPFTSRSDPNSFNRIQIMGRPFRWG